MSEKKDNETKYSWCVKIPIEGYLVNKFDSYKDAESAYDFLRDKKDLSRVSGFVTEYVVKFSQMETSYESDAVIDCSEESKEEEE